MGTADDEFSNFPPPNLPPWREPLVTELMPLEEARDRARDAVGSHVRAAADFLSLLVNAELPAVVEWPPGTFTPVEPVAWTRTPPDKVSKFPGANYFVDRAVLDRLYPPPGRKGRVGAPPKADAAAVKTERQRRLAAGEPAGHKVLAKFFAVSKYTIGRHLKK